MRSWEPYFRWGRTSGQRTEGKVAAADGAGGRGADRRDEFGARAGGLGAAGDGVAGGDAGRDARRGGRAGGVPERHDGRGAGRPVQSARPGGSRCRRWARPAADVWRGGAGADCCDRPAGAGPPAGRDGALIVEHAGAEPPPRRPAARRGDDEPAGAGGGRQLVLEDADMVPDRDGPAAAPGRGGHGDRPADRGKKGRIERADEQAEEAGVALWCQDEAGP
jgi:hypothetical protein